MKQASILILLAFTFFLVSCGRKTEETTPIKKDVTELVFASGILEANNTYNLTAQTDGYLLKLNFNEGDLVEAGTVLAEVENTENVLNTESTQALYQIAESNATANAPAILQAKSAWLLAKQKMQLDSTQYSRYKILYEKQAVSKVECENYALQYNTSQSNYFSALENYKLVKQQSDQQLISSKASKNINAIHSSNNQIKAVVSGKVYKKLKQPGDYVRRGDAIATIGDANILYAKVNIDEENIHKVKLGQEAIIQLNTQQDKIYKGVVTEIYPSFNETTQSFTCKISFLDSLDFKITGTQLQANIKIKSHVGALLIPRNYLNFDGTVLLKGAKETTPVVTNFISKDWVQISSGLDENSKISTDNIQTASNSSSELGSQMMK
jgi:HlyD family secretion protein